jgi:exodeoxyribonuclease V alpha subunit
LIASGEELDGNRPLVLDASGRLYLRRYWEHQQEVIAAIQRRVAGIEAIDDSEWLRTALDRLFPRGPASAAGGTDWQRIAAAVALQRSFCVISGGPGTGKTFTVVKILALMIERALRRGVEPPRVSLVAPTGKAAARLSESIRRAKAGLQVDPQVAELISDEASTIHRCLGTFVGSATRTRHHRENPLATDIVLVDEASMVDLALLRRLLDATPDDARVILLGDKDQLASVEAGAVLGDICNSGRSVTYSRPWRERLVQLTGEPLPATKPAPKDTGIWDCMVQLRYSYRTERAPAIAVLAEAINAGDAAQALRVLEDNEFVLVGLTTLV